MPYDDSTITAVRLFANDPAPEGSSPIFSDAEIAIFLDNEMGDPVGSPISPNFVVKRAAADAIDVIASNEALVLKVITDRQLTTNGAAVAQSLRAQSAALRAQADVDEEKSDTGFFYDVISPGDCWPL